MATSGSNDDHGFIKPAINNTSGEKQLKIVILGDAFTGKTSLASRATVDSIPKQYQQTAGVDFFRKNLTLNSTGANVVLHIWDVGGGGLRTSMFDKYLYGANVVAVVYDITNTSTFESIIDWLDAARRATKHQKYHPKFAILANKCDMEHMRAVRGERHVQVCQDHCLSSFSVSARTGEGVNLCFKKLTAEFLGVKLTRQELEQAERVVTAEIGSARASSGGLTRPSMAHPEVAAAGAAEAAARAAARVASASSSSASNNVRSSSAGTGLKPPYGTTSPSSMVCDIQ